jgi:hypothetical protein
MPPLLIQDLMHARDRLVDSSLGAETVGHDAVHRLGPDAFRLDQLVSPLTGCGRLAVVVGVAQELHDRCHTVRVVRV